MWEIDWYQNEWLGGLVPKDHQQEMAYGVSNGHVADDVTWPPKELWGSTVGYPSDSLASCLIDLLKEQTTGQWPGPALHCQKETF